MSGYIWLDMVKYYLIMLGHVCSGYFR